MLSPGVVEHDGGQVLAGLRQVGHGQAEGGQEPALRRTHTPSGPPLSVWEQKSSLTFRFSRSLAASLGWLKRNMLVLPSRMTAPGGSRARLRVGPRRRSSGGKQLLTLVELGRLAHQDPVDRTLGAAEGHHGHRPALVLKHAVLALQVQAVQDYTGVTQRSDS